VQRMLRGAPDVKGIHKSPPIYISITDYVIFGRSGIMYIIEEYIFDSVHRLRLLSSKLHPPMDDIQLAREDFPAVLKMFPP
jgi:hypothetical protein